jgi:hypothetical protein
VRRLNPGPFSAACLSLLALLSVACGQRPSQRQPAQPTPTATPTQRNAATPATTIPLPFSTATATPGTAPTADASQYVDNRSTAATLVASYYNAISRKEYARAFGYWEPAAAKQELAPFEQFRQGYADTAAVQVLAGPVQEDVGAGQLAWRVPVALIARTTAGNTQAFTGCYTVHVSRPDLQAAPPYDPLRIQAASVHAVAEDVAKAQLNQACTTTGSQPSPGSEGVSDTGTPAYLDDRSSPEVLLQSYYNAITRKEYARAYSYWDSEAAAAQLPAFAQFRDGYTQTTAAQINTGPVSQGGHGGVLDYSVPVRLSATTSAGEHQSFAGCYHIQQIRPALQGAPPFQPLRIASAHLGPVDGNQRDTAEDCTALP